MKAASLLCLIALWFALGCSSNEPKKLTTSTGTTEGQASAGTEKLSEQDKLFEQFRSGMSQMSTVNDMLIAFVEDVNFARTGVKGSAGVGLQEAADSLVSAGTSLADNVEPIPEKELFFKAIQVYDEIRLKCIEAGNDAIVDLKSAEGIIGDIVQQDTGPLKKKLAPHHETLNSIIDDLAEAITSFGGKVIEQ